MTEKRYVVPEGMLKAVQLIAPDRLMPDIHITTVKGVLEAALLWLAKNPIVPPYDRAQIFAESLPYRIECEHTVVSMNKWAVEWQCRMFEAPEPEVPEEIKDLWQSAPTPPMKQRILEAYRRGKASK